MARRKSRKRRGRKNTGHLSTAVEEVPKAIDPVEPEKPVRWVPSVERARPLREYNMKYQFSIGDPRRWNGECLDMILKRCPQLYALLYGELDGLRPGRPRCLTLRTEHYRNLRFVVRRPWLGSMGATRVWTERSFDRERRTNRLAVIGMGAMLLLMATMYVLVPYLFSN